MNAIRRLIFFLLVFLPGLLFASLIFFPADGRKKRDNPADQRGTNYQGYDSSNESQSLIIVNSAALENGETSVAELSNVGWKPLRYKLSLDSGFSDNPGWNDMPASRRFSFALSSTPGDQTIYGKFVIAGNKEVQANASCRYFGRAIFVDIANGNDTNAGSPPAQAVKTLTTGYALAVLNHYSNILVAGGTYSRANGGLNASGDGLIVTQSGMKFFGGYNATFTSFSKYSVLDAQQLAGSRVIFFSNVDNVALTGFHLRGGSNYAPSMPWGGGMLLYGVNGGTFTNLLITSNFSSNEGGGVAMHESKNILLAGYIGTNFCPTSASGGKGGGISMSNCSWVTNSVIMETNGAAFGYQFYLTGSASSNNYLSGVIRNSWSSIALDGAITLQEFPGAMTIENCVVTNNYGHALQLAFTAPFNNQPGLIVRNSLLGTQAIAGRVIISEFVAGAPNDVSNHSIYNNVFVTNTLGGFYLDNASTTTAFSAYSIMNTPFHINHDALVGGNTFQP